MKLFRKWLHGNNQKLHIAIKHSILEYAIPRGGPIEFYRDIIKELKGISLGLGRDQKGLIKKIREANDELSKVSNTRKGRKGDIKQKNFVEYGRKKRFQQRRSK